MRFSELVDQAIDFLRQRTRVSYRALKREFDLDEDALADLTTELIDAQCIARDEDGKVLVWTGGTGVVSSQLSVLSASHTPSPQTPNSELRTSQSLAERRQLTVMFIDLVGSTTLSQQLDPEDYHARVVAYQTACHQVVARYAGHIAQYLGDGVLAYFGYPAAHEDDAVRAVRSGLEIVTAVSQLAYTPRLQVRIGIHTGPVVVGEIGAGERTERLALGETPNIAARVQGTANPEEVMMSAATYRLVEGLFDTEDRGQPALKGVTTPLTLYRVVKESEAHSRFEVEVRRGLTPLIGREAECGLLQERWERVKAGTGQVVLVSGEAGIGKSRLVEALKESVEHEGGRFLELRCSPYAQNSALQPVIEHLQRTLHFRPDDTPDEKLQKLSVGAHSSAPLPTENIPLLAALLSLPHPQDFPALTLSPQKQKEKTYEALVTWLGAAAKHQAMTYAWEDLHWADPSTLELLTRYLAQVPTTQLLAVLTFRPEFVPPWGSHSYFSQLTLSRLGQPHVEVMLEKVTSGKALPKEVIQQIVSKTDGVPLFVEELTKMIVESGLVTEGNGHYELTGPLPLLAIPSTLQDSLMARLDRLGAAKEIAQVGATIGREFNHELLQAVSPLDVERLQYGLKQLVDAELLYQRGLPPQATYLFKHALIQDTAYQSLLKSKRQHYHQQIASVLEARFPDTAKTQPELVAQHYTEAHLVAQAIPYWQRAGERATQRSAHVEAIAHLTKGIELLKTLPDTPERAPQELTLQLALGTELTDTKGYAAPAVEHAYTRALELCRHMEASPQLFSALRGLQLFYMMRAEFPKARTLAEQLLSLAQRQHDPVLLLGAHSALGQTLYYLGDLALALAHLEQGLALYDPQQPQYQTWAGGYLGIQCVCYAAWVLWHLGYPDQALQKSQEALTLAEELSHPVSLATVLYAAVVLHYFRRDWQSIQERTAALMPLATEQGFAFRVSRGTIFRGRMLVEQGQVEEGLAQIRQGIAADQAIGAAVGGPLWLTLLAEAYGKGGQVDEGLKVLAEGLTIAHKTGEGLHEAELYRLKGTLTLQKLSVISSQLSVPNTQHPTPNPQAAAELEAEGYFLKAIEIARQQQAKSLELRAVMSLVRLRQHQAEEDATRNTHHEPQTTHPDARHKLNEAHQMLSDVYHWFTEGFDTKDLQEAKALLDELA